MFNSKVQQGQEGMGKGANNPATNKIFTNKFVVSQVPPNVFSWREIKLPKPVVHKKNPRTTFHLSLLIITEGEGDIRILLH